jgi:endonuclease/exonuclease/phosphatase family metal-dependent hydrolase
LLPYREEVDVAVSLRVATFNIRNSSAPDGQYAWPMRRYVTVAAINALDADVIGLQEVLPDQLAFLRSAFRSHRVLGGGRDRSGTGEHSTVLVRPGAWTVESEETRWLSDEPDTPGSVGWDADLPRIVTLVRLRHETGPLAGVANTHFDHAGKQAQLESAQLLHRWLSDEPDRAWVLLGDLNTVPGSPPLTALLEAGWQDPLPEASGGTWHDFTGATDRDRIDHILHGPGWTADRAWVSYDRPGGLLPSDHWPVAADLRLD